MIKFCSQNLKLIEISKYMFKSDKANMSKPYSFLRQSFSNDHLDTVAPKWAAKKSSQAYL